MWALRILTGPQTGQILNLKLGKNLLGRGPACDIKITSHGVSKEHSEIHVYKDKIMIVDLKSSNGTFVNGVRVQNGLVRLGDKASVHDVIFDIIPADIIPIRSVAQPASGYNSNPASAIPMMGSAAPQYYPEAQAGYMGGAPQMMPSPQMMSGQPGFEEEAAPSFETAPRSFVQNFLFQLKDYLERVALPGIYRLPQLAEFKYVLAGFIVLFVLTVTLLSMIPMIQITRSSILEESQRRAQSLARNVAMTNQTLLLQGSFSSLNTHSAETEEGVKQVMIVQQSDGMILAPAGRAGTTPDIPFVHAARREMKAQVGSIDGQTIGASFPIGQYDPATGEPSIKAHAVVIYDISTLAFDDGKVLSLFFQTLLMACFVGMILFFVMYKLIEFPINALNGQLDLAMREKRDATEVNFQFPALQALISNINSLLTRYVHGDSEKSGPSVAVNREAEAENLLQLIGYPSLAISGEKRIIAVNSSFEHISHSSAAQLNGQPITAISDGALQQNLLFLIQKSQEIPGVIHSDQLEFSGHNCQIHCQAMGVENNSVAYFVISITPVEGGGE